jgi:hypothetical protein
MKEALSSSETSGLTRAKRHNIAEDAILHSHRRENLKSYILLLMCALVSIFLHLYVAVQSVLAPGTVAMIAASLPRCLAAVSIRQYFKAADNRKGPDWWKM